MESEFSVDSSMDMPMDGDFSATFNGQPMDPGAAAGMAAVLGGFALVFFLLVLAIYVYMAVCLMKIAKKTDTPNGWLAWIPIANFALMLMIAKRPMWWLAFLLAAFIPFVGPLVVLVVMVIVWMDICARLGKEKWLGILMIVPVANLILPGYLAFSSSAPVAPARPEGPSGPLAG